MAMRFPFHISSRGCTDTASSSEDAYVRDLLEQVLLTSPGERVNRPDFGSGLLGMVFALRFRSGRKGSTGKTGVVSVISNTLGKLPLCLRYIKCYRLRSGLRSVFGGLRPI